MFRFYLKNTLLSPAMIVAVLGMWIGMLLGCDFSPDVTYSLHYTISIGVTSYFIPVATILPVFYLMRQMNKGYIRNLCLFRSSMNMYSWGAVGSAILSGLSVLALTFLFFTLFLFLYSALFLGEPYFGIGLFLYSDGFYCLINNNFILLYLYQGIIFILNGAIWPVITLVSFAFTTNSYVTLAIPFIIRVALSWLTQGTVLYFLDPGQLLLGGGIMAGTFGNGIPYLLTYVCIVILLCGIVWRFKMERSLQNG